LIDFICDTIKEYGSGTAWHLYRNGESKSNTLLFIPFFLWYGSGTVWFVVAMYIFCQEKDYFELIWNSILLSVSHVDENEKLQTILSYHTVPPFPWNPFF
jgi:hypothetical protein